jgi:THO complex subunit 2
VLATGVAAALAARKVRCYLITSLFLVCFSTLISSNMQPYWVTGEEFGMGYIVFKSAPSMTKSAVGNSAAIQSGIGLHVSLTESASGKHLDSGNTVKDQTARTKTTDDESERTESITATKSDSGHVKLKGSSMVNELDAQSSLPSPAGQSGALKSAENPKQVQESISRAPDEHVTRTVEVAFTYLCYVV